MKFRLWTVIPAIVIIIALGLMLPRLMSNQQASVAVDYQEVKKEAMKAFETALVETIEAVDEEVKKRSDAVVGETVVEETTATTENSATPTPTATPQVTVAVVGEEKDIIVVIEDEEIALSDSNIYVKDEWINSKINENKDQIDMNDLDRGAEIFNRLDTQYLFDLADGGLTPEKKLLVDEYLKNNLSGSEYEITRSLYFRYVGLLKND